MTQLLGRIEITVRLSQAGNSDVTTRGIAASKNRHGAATARPLTGFSAGEGPGVGVGVERQPLWAMPCS